VAGDAGTMLQGAIMAAASGASAAAFINHSLITRDTEGPEVDLEARSA
jgi:hypothetical protein